ncbi:MAG: NAD-binding protein [Bacteroidetes bacterium]|nr:NAD-binding protein [Bacteroidota bacterium]
MKSSGVLVWAILRAFITPLVSSAAFVVGVTLLYMHTEGVSWIDGFFWITHPHAIPETSKGATKLFAVGVYAGVVLFQIWIVERILVSIFNKEAKKIWSARVNDLKISRLKNHFIICGYGQVGRTVIDQLIKSKYPFVLIETNEGLCSELTKEGILVLNGSAKRRDLLMTARIHKAHSLCVLIDNDADNLYISITAKALNPKVKIICRAGQVRYAEAMKNAGVDSVVIPEHEGGLMVARQLQEFMPAEKKFRLNIETEKSPHI